MNIDEVKRGDVKGIVVRPDPHKSYEDGHVELVNAFREVRIKAESRFLVYQPLHLYQAHMDYFGSYLGCTGITRYDNKNYVVIELHDMAKQAELEKLYPPVQKRTDVQ